MPRSHDAALISLITGVAINREKTKEFTSQKTLLDEERQCAREAMMQRPHKAFWEGEEFDRAFG